MKAMEDRRRVEDGVVEAVEEVGKVELDWIQSTKGKEQVKRRCKFFGIEFID